MGLLQCSRAELRWAVGVGGEMEMEESVRMFVLGLDGCNESFSLASAIWAMVVCICYRRGRVRYESIWLGV